MGLTVGSTRADPLRVLTALELAKRVSRAEANAGLLRWSGRGGSEWKSGVVGRLSPWVEGFDEGAAALFLDYAKELPADVRWTMGTLNVCLHPATGRIFAIHFGRYTFLHRRADGGFRIANYAESLDGSTSLIGLEPQWCTMSPDSWTLADEVQPAAELYQWASRTD